MIRRATLKDAERIYEIAQESSARTMCDGKKGFLVSDYKLEDYRDQLESLVHVYVLEDDDNVVQAFLTVRVENELDKGLKVNQELLERSTRPYAVIQQICVAVNARRRGYAKALYQFIMDTLDLDIYLTVVVEPPNEASITFHESLGFEAVFRVRPEDRRLRQIFYWKND